MPRQLEFLQYKYRSILVIIIFAAAKISADLLYDGQRYFADSDDMLRFFQIRDLFYDRQWFDMQLPFISMPEPYVSPWSRLVDLPYLVLSSLLSFFTSPENALLWATWTVPPLLLLAFAWLLVDVVHDCLDRAPTMLESFLVVAFLGTVVYEFSPGRIDHHNFQFLACLMLAKGLVGSNPRSSASWLGMGSVYSVCIGLELVPIIAATYAIIGCRAAKNDYGSLIKLQFSGIVIALATPVFALLFLGFHNSLATYCDAFSLVWIVALEGGAALLLIIPAIWQLMVDKRTGLSNFMERIILAVSFAGLFGALLLMLFPTCADGVYHMVNDTSRNFWLNNVEQEKSGAFLFAPQKFFEYGLGVAASLLIAGLVIVNLSQRKTINANAVVAICALVGFSVCMTLIQQRYAKFLVIFAALLLPALFEILGISKRAGTQAPSINKPASAIVTLLVGLLVLVSALWAGEPKGKNKAAHIMASTKCDWQDMSALHNLEPSRILVPFGMAYKLVALNAGHQVLAMEFHRASPGIKRLALAFTSEDPALRNWALEPVDHVVVCASEYAGDFDGAPLYRKLVEGTPTAGFELIANPVKTHVLIYRVNHEKLAI